MSVVKWAPTTTLLSATTKPKNKKNNLKLGINNPNIRATEIIVEECPEGKEWNEASVEKKLKLVPILKSTWFGLVLPITCFKIWVTKPTNNK